MPRPLFSYLLSACCIATGCSSQWEHPRAMIGEVFGTFYSIKYYGEKPLPENELKILFNEINSSVSIFSSLSCISTINNGGNTRVSPIFSDVFKWAKQAYIETDGWFDPTVGPLVQAYGFADSSSCATQNDVTEIMKSVGFKYVTLEKGCIKKDNPDTRLDFSGIAKGYAVDAVCALLEKHNIYHYMVEIGGEVRTGGTHLSSNPWIVGIESPINDNMERSIVRSISLKDMAVATSGNYRRHQKDSHGNVSAHIVNPHTGSAVPSDVLSATIVYPQCVMCDAYATALVAMGYEKSVSWLKKHPDVQAFLIYLDDKKVIKTYCTPFFPLNN